jgi:RecA/RadA recombinase
MDFDKLMADLSDVVGNPDADKPVPYFLPTSLPNVNLAVSGKQDGGFPGGRIITIAGPESCGKTALATELMAEGQRKNGFAFFVDHEHAFHAPHAITLGLNTEKGWYYKKPNLAEEGFGIAYKVMETLRTSELGLPAIASKESDETALKRRMILRDKLKSADLSKLMPIVGVMDSIASMIPASQDIDFAKQNMKTKNLDLAAMLSLELKRLARDADNSGTTMILLNQLRENPGIMFGDKSSEPGGNAPRFYASTMLRLRRVKKLYAQWDDDKSEIIGDVVELFVRKNKIWRPFKKTQYVFRTVDPVGLDPVSTMIYLGKNAGILGPVSGVTVQFAGTKHNANELIKKGHADPKLKEELIKFVMGQVNPVEEGPAVVDEEEKNAFGGLAA